MINESLMAQMLELHPNDLRLLARFLATVKLDHGHLIWTGEITENGYGRFWTPGGKMPAHHYLWGLLYEPVPEQHELHHVCRRRPCVNPHCLQLLSDEQHRELHAQEQRNVKRCPAGHPYDEVNTRRYRGRRYCRACNNNGRRPIEHSRLPELQAQRRAALPSGGGVTFPSADAALRWMRETAGESGSLRSARLVYRDLAKRMHPDAGGDAGEWEKLSAARLLMTSAGLL